jgi:hypothetical protein
MRYPFAPLEPLIEAKWRPMKENDVEHAGITAKASRLLETSRGSVIHWRKAGMNEKTADRVACALGYHPGLVWPEWWQQ